MIHFTSFGLQQSLMNSIAKLGYKTPTGVQSSTIPVILSGRDVVSLAETGSGKTGAFVIPIVQRTIGNPNEYTLILAPTRELALQIGEVVRSFTLHNPTIRHSVLIGGQSMYNQIKSLKNQPQIIIATPGRLIDHATHKIIDLRKVTCFVLDEADRMFDMGFAPQINRIVPFLPRERQTLLFSATFPNEIKNLAHKILRNPVELEVQKKNRPPAVIKQKVLEIGHADKNDKLLDIVNSAKGPVLVFTRTKHRTNRVSQYLEEYGVKVTRIHGDRSQCQRNKSISDFKSGRANVMVATDIAARGLDIANISDVINYDIPVTVEDYVHRIGRTGRAGQEGQALTMVTPEDRKNWQYIARKMGHASAAEKGHGQGHGHGHGGAKSNHGKTRSTKSFRAW